MGGRGVLQVYRKKEGATAEVKTNEGVVVLHLSVQTRMGGEVRGRTSCSSASRATSSVSSGFIHRASATVTPTSLSEASSARAACTASASRVPNDKMATFRLDPTRAPRMMRPLPTGSAVPRSG